MREQLDMQQKEMTPSLQDIPTLTFAEGSVDPSARLASGEISAQTVTDVIERLKGDEFYDDIPHGQIACKCMDCLSRTDGSQELGSNAAGGTITLVVADALTHNSYRHEGENVAVHAKRIITELKKKEQESGTELPVGIHGNELAVGSNCGCGAIDKLDDGGMLDEQGRPKPSILKFMIRKEAEIRAVVDSLQLNVGGASLEVDDTSHNMIMANAQELTSSGYAVDGKQVTQAVVEAAGPQAVEALTGKQLAVAAVVNSQEGKTLNRHKLVAEFGEAYQVFNIDLPGIVAGAREISISEDEARQKTIAGLYFNLAAAGVIGGRLLPVVIR